MRKPILQETGRVWVGSGEGVDLCFGEVLAISEAKTKRSDRRATHEKNWDMVLTGGDWGR